MQKAHRISLNAVRVFATVARTGSLAAAGAELHVTPSAVSHQLRKLEDELRTGFFRRGPNTVALTEVGLRFYQEVAPAIALIERTADALYRDETQIGVQASTSLAVRWLIPSLDRFRVLCPQAHVRVETAPAQGLPAGALSDVGIRYFRAGAAVEEWDLLAPDLSRPVVAPRLLTAGGRKRKIALASLPALQRAAGNWDWKLWCKASAIPMADLSFAHAFDTDDAALHACVAGLGVVLAPPILTLKEIRSGALVALPGHEPVEIGTYRFQRRSESRAVRQFCEWLGAEALDQSAPGASRAASRFAV